MAIRNRITEAKRIDPKRSKKGRHPLITNFGTPHFSVWQTIVQQGNPKGGMNAAQIAAACHVYHPQVLSDLRAAKLVIEARRSGNTKYYVADPNGRGIHVQKVQIQVDLYEAADGAFLTRATLLGQVKTSAPIVRKLKTRTITVAVPLPYEPGVEQVEGVVLPSDLLSGADIDADNVIEGEIIK